MFDPTVRTYYHGFTLYRSRTIYLHWLWRGGPSLVISGGGGGTELLM